MTIEIPEVLRAKVDAYVERRRVEYSRYSVKDAIFEALRQLVEGPGDPQGLAQNIVQRGAAKPAARMTPDQLIASIPGLRLGVPKTEEEFDQRPKEEREW